MGLKALRALWYSLRHCRVPEELGELGALTRLVAASRLCVVFMTVYAVIMGGLLAWLRGPVDPLLLLAILAGFTAAHIADNLLNDLSDYTRSVDVPGYFRTLYGPHPVIDGLVAPGTIKAFVLTIIALNMVLALYLAIHVTPIILVLAVVGAVSMALYSGYPVDAKALGLGELLVVIVWGPVMVGGTMAALTGYYDLHALIAYTPFAAAVELVLIGKHMDKYEDDLAKGIRTLPIRLGLHNAMKLGALIAILAPITASLGLYAYTGSPYSFLVMASIATALTVARAFSEPKPGEPPRDWRVWPLWYAPWGYILMESIGRSTILSLVVIGAVSRGLLTGTLATVILALLGFMELRNGMRLLRYTEKHRSEGGPASSIA